MCAGVDTRIGTKLVRGAAVLPGLENGVQRAVGVLEDVAAESARRGMYLYAMSQLGNSVGESWNDE